MNWKIWFLFGLKLVKLYVIKDRFVWGSWMWKDFMIVLKGIMKMLFILLGVKGIMEREFIFSRGKIVFY